MSIEIDVQLGKAGRVVIPVNVRRKYELQDGDWLKLILILDSEKEYKESTTPHMQEDKESCKV